MTSSTVSLHVINPASNIKRNTKGNNTYCIAHTLTTIAHDSVNHDYFKNTICTLVSSSAEKFII